MPTKKPGRGANKKGRSIKGGKFVRLGDGLLTSEAWRSLSGSAVRYYLELRRRYNGSNNGRLYLSLDEAKNLLHIGKATAQRAQTELVKKGFIRMTRKGGFHQRLATTWALTDERTVNAPPTNDFKKWTAEKQSIGSETERTRFSDGTKTPKKPAHRSKPEPTNGQSEHTFGSEMEHF